MGKCLFMRKGETHKAPAKSFADTSWVDIITACQSGSVPEKWAVGDSKPMTINGIEYQIDIIGKHHDVYSDGSGTAPLTLQLHDAYATGYGMHASATNVGGWHSCVMRTTHLPTIMSLMPSEIQTAIKSVDKKTSDGNLSSIIKTTADKLFLLSESEVSGTSVNSYSGEGEQYAYYAAGNSRNKMLKNNSDSSIPWWMRSPANADRYCFVCHSNTQGMTYFGANREYGVAFAFCF